MAQIRNLSAYEMATAIVKQSGIAGEAYQDQTPEGMSRQENLQELLSGIHQFCETRKEEGSETFGLMDFLSEVSLLSDQDTDKEADKEKVTMMTIHASKGLEFKNVFIVGLEEDLFPSSMAKNEMRGLEEERRLFYVAITRAEDFCMLTYAKSRFRNGQINACNPSRFLKDIDASYLNMSGSLLFGNTPPEYSANDEYEDKVSKTDDHYTNKLQFSSSSSFLPLESAKPQLPKSNFVNAKIAKPKLSAGGNDSVNIGDIIRHERFGIGKVTNVSGDIDSRKATVEFENSGTKQLLLKFARFQIIK